MLIDVRDGQATAAGGELRRIGACWTLVGRRLEGLAGGGFDVDDPKNRAGEGGRLSSRTTAPA